MQTVENLSVRAALFTSLSASVLYTGNTGKWLVFPFRFPFGCTACSLSDAFPSLGLLSAPSTQLHSVPVTIENRMWSHLTKARKRKRLVVENKNILPFTLQVPTSAALNMENETWYRRFSGYSIWTFVESRTDAKSLQQSCMNPKGAWQFTWTFSGGCRLPAANTCVFTLKMTCHHLQWNFVITSRPAMSFGWTSCDSVFGSHLAGAHYGPTTFLLHVNQRRRRNHVSTLQVDGATLVAEEKAGAAFNYFSGILGTTHHREGRPDFEALGIHWRDLSSLGRPFTVEEIWAVVKVLPLDKAPGPDGFTSSFYHSA
jgi:hypothetical protein